MQYNTHSFMVLMTTLTLLGFSHLDFPFYTFFFLFSFSSIYFKLLFIKKTASVKVNPPSIDKAESIVISRALSFCYLATNQDKKKKEFKALVLCEDLNIIPSSFLSLSLSTSFPFVNNKYPYSRKKRKEEKEVL